MTKVSGVYVLRLEQNKWYVGFSDDVNRRVQKHVRSGGSSWTRLYPVIEVYSVVPGAGTDYERLVTLSLMKQCGWENVRGAGWCSAYLAYPPMELR